MVALLAPAHLEHIARYLFHATIERGDRSSGPVAGNHPGCRFAILWFANFHAIIRCRFNPLVFGRYQVFSKCLLLAVSHVVPQREQP